MHHAYLIVGSLSDARTSIDSFEIKNDTDTVCTEYEKFGIGDARQLKEAAAQRPVENTHRIFILVIKTITVEAQNALLKLFEEPPLTSQFYMVAPSEGVLIDTLRSRLFKIDARETEVLASEIAETFMKLSFADRLSLVAEKMKEKDVSWATDLLNELEVYVVKEKDENILSAILFVRKYFAGRSSSKKMLLEHLALSLPIAT